MNEFTRTLRPTLERYAASTGLGSPEEDEAIVKDLLNDLRHWCDQQGWNFELLDLSASSQYESEKRQLNLDN